MLNDILINRQKQVAQNKALYPVKLLEQSIYFDSETVSLRHYITRPDKSGIIAEFKRKSPSKGVINPYATVQETTIGYMQAGASALSILTENTFFMGKDDDLIKARHANYCPILRKDFILEEYQVIETKSIGADAILLIAAALDKATLATLYHLSKALGLEVLFEVHDLEDLDKLPGSDLIIGVNNRNLKTMHVDIQTSISIAEYLSKDFVLVSESGLNKVSDIQTLKAVGYSGFLMGEHFMATPNPAETLTQFINQLKVLEYAN